MGMGMNDARARAAWLGTVAAAAALIAGCGGGSTTTVQQVAGSASADLSSDYGTEYENTGTGPMVEPTVPSTPSVKTYYGKLDCADQSLSPDAESPAPDGCTRVFHLTAEELTQKLANFPLKTAAVWGYAAPGIKPSTPGPTLISYQGETVQVIEKNKLPEPTTIHPHGLHQPNADDGVAVISQPKPIEPGEKYAYPAFVPGHVGTFAYHAHFDSAVQEQRGLDGMWDVLPREEHESIRVDEDFNMTLQIWGWMKNGGPVAPFGLPPGGAFPIDTINGKTGDASGGPLTIHEGDLVRIRLYNASQQTHSMHLHGQDIVAISKNGHAIPPERETTQTVNPGDFYEVEFRADNPGNWIFHCHFPHHTANGMNSGFGGAPVGMTRIFHYAGAPKVNPKYFSAAHYTSPSLEQ